ncbi:SDR family NAD(P)-dependent oxidoreductase [Pontibacter toksunensis]|uniref:SDR family NAD(P)-dependent oxidoreductase n=1 Tax=Pontibacter toksunensis TaxID=1332631 RepID=A0ABW6C5E4_9BACT
MKVENKVILVTGGGSGMGRELVLQLIAKGAKVITIDINAAALQETLELAGNNASSVKTFLIDITDRRSVEELVPTAISQFGVVDGIINNAGIIQPFIKLNDLSFETIERVININLYGTLYTTKAFLPHLISRPEAHIVNISSMGGFLPVPGQTIYGATKAAVKLLTEGLNSELKNTKVHVTVVFPGAVRTNIMGNSGLDNAASMDDPRAARITSAQQAAQVIIRGMESNQYRVLVGKDAKIMDFLYRLNPKAAAAFISKRMKRV